MSLRTKCTAITASMCVERHAVGARSCSWSRTLTWASITLGWITDRSLTPEACAQIIERLWTAFDQQRLRHDDERRRRNQRIITNKEIAEEVGMSDRTLGEWLKKRSLVPDWPVFAK